MSVWFVIIFIGLGVIIWSTAYAITALACTLTKNKEHKRIEAWEKEYRERDKVAREAREKIWAERFSQMSQEDYEDFMNCPFT